MFIFKLFSRVTPINQIQNRVNKNLLDDKDIQSLVAWHESQYSVYLNEKLQK